MRSATIVCHPLRVVYALRAGLRMQACACLLRPFPHARPPCLVSAAEERVGAAVRVGACRRVAERAARQRQAAEQTAAQAAQQTLVLCA